MAGLEPGGLSSNLGEEIDLFPYGVMVARNAVNVLVLVRVQVGELESYSLTQEYLVTSQEV